MSEYTIHKKVLNTTSIPSIAEPFSADILWLQLLTPSKKSGAVNHSMHRHTFIEVHFPVSGVIEYQLANGNVLRANAGEYMFFPVGEDHMFRDAGCDYEKFVLSFSCDDPQLSFSDIAYTASQTEAMRHGIALAVSAAKINTNLTPYLLRAAIMPMIVDTAVYSGMKMKPESDDIRLARAKQLIMDNCMHALHSKDVANAMHFSKRQLDRLFQKSEGSTVEKYIKQVRCEAVKSLLDDTTLSLHEIAEKLSFSNEYNLIRFFKREEGLTPGAYRKARNYKMGSAGDADCYAFGNSDEVAF